MALTCIYNGEQRQMAEFYSAPYLHSYSLGWKPHQETGPPAMVDGMFGMGGPPGTGPHTMVDGMLHHLKEVKLIAHKHAQRLVSHIILVDS